MVRSSLERDFTGKKEGDNDDGKNPQEPSSPRPWSALKDPRIVRVSRSFGGKDRHSKVRTIRGLRDRRIRLSVPTAIQLYDLQERLGLNQPSKVVDWLINAAQHAIDELPLLQMPAENYVQDSQPTAASHEVATSQAHTTSLLFAHSEHSRSSGSPHSLTLLSGKGDAKSRNDLFGTDQTASTKSMYWDSNEHFRAKLKDVRRETITEKSGWMKRTEQENQQPIEVHSAQRWIHSSLPRPSHSFLTGSLNNVMPYTSHYHLELPSNVSVSHSGVHGTSSQTEELHNYNTIPLPSSLALPSGSQLLFYPSGTTPSLIPSYITHPNDFDPKQIANFQMLSSSSQNVQPNSITTRAIQLSIAPMDRHSHNNHVSQSNALEKGTNDNGPSSSTETGSYLHDPKVALGSNPSSFM